MLRLALRAGHNVGHAKEQVIINWFRQKDHVISRKGNGRSSALLYYSRVTL